MKQFLRKVVPFSFIALALVLGAWTASPAKVQSSGSQGDTERWDQVPGVTERINTISSFKMDVSKVNSSNTSEADKSFVEEALTSNSLELVSLQYAVGRVQNSEWNSLVQMMIDMHSKDQEIILALAKNLGIDTSVDFRNASVYPETPSYDLGKRTEDLDKEYLKPLKTVTSIDFDKLSLDILESEHVSDIQSEPVAERLVTNNELRAFAKHSADVTALHIDLMDYFHDKGEHHYAVAPDYQEAYQDPFQFKP